MNSTALVLLVVIVLAVLTVTVSSRLKPTVRTLQVVGIGQYQVELDYIHSDPQRIELLTDTDSNAGIIVRAREPHILLGDHLKRMHEQNTGQTFVWVRCRAPTRPTWTVSDTVWFNAHEGPHRFLVSTDGRIHLGHQAYFAHEIQKVSCTLDGEATAVLCQQPQIGRPPLPSDITIVTIRGWGILGGRLRREMAVLENGWVWLQDFDVATRDLKHVEIVHRFGCSVWTAFFSTSAIHVLLTNNSQWYSATWPVSPMVECSLEEVRIA